VIGWRNPDIFKDRFHARTQVLWLHDVAVREQWPDQALDIVDKVIVLSKFHRTVIPFVPESKIVYSRNGIHPSEFSPPMNNPKKVIYASNPTRGLKNLLLIWPEVHKRTGAELSLFYGFTDWHRHLVSCSPHEQKYMIEIGNMLDYCKDFGVKDYGMIPPKELSKHMASCGVWAYPTTFDEISCMIGIEAQCMGAIPVVTNYAALEETVQFGEKIEWNKWEDYPLDEYKEKLIAMILDPKRQESIRKDMVPWARKNFLWKDVANQFYRILEVGDCRPLKWISPQKDSEKILVSLSK